MLEVPYSELCANPIDTYRKVAEHCRLNWSSDFQTHVGKFHLRDNDFKWREHLTQAQQQILTETLRRGRAHREDSQDRDLRQVS